MSADFSDSCKFFKIRIMPFDFLTAYKELQLKTPRFSAFILNSENSDYNFNVENAKNCYLIANSVDSRDCMYGRDFYGCEDCTDCDHCHACTLCYQCLNCDNCYDCDYLQDSLDSYSCRYGYFLKGCKDCIGCSGLKQKRFHIFNEPYSEEQYAIKIKELTDEEIVKNFETLKRKVPRIGIMQVDSENFTGMGIFHSRNVDVSFDVSECQDCGYLLECKNVTDSWDITILENSELCYNISSSRGLHNCNCCYFCLNSSDLEYCENLIECNNCFGCIGLRRKQYHILNEPYEPDGYFRKVEEIKSALCASKLYGKMLIPPTFPREDTVVMMPTL